MAYSRTLATTLAVFMCCRCVVARRHSPILRHDDSGWGFDETDDAVTGYACSSYQSSLSFTSYSYSAEFLCCNLSSASFCWIVSQVSVIHRLDSSPLSLLFTLVVLQARQATAGHRRFQRYHPFEWYLRSWLGVSEVQRVKQHPELLPGCRRESSFVCILAISWGEYCTSCSTRTCICAHACP